MSAAMDTFADEFVIAGSLYEVVLPDKATGPIFLDRPSAQAWVESLKTEGRSPIVSSVPLWKKKES